MGKSGFYVNYRVQRVTERGAERRGEEKLILVAMILLHQKFFFLFGLNEVPRINGGKRLAMSMKTLIVKVIVLPKMQSA